MQQKLLNKARLLGLASALVMSGNVIPTDVYASVSKATEAKSVLQQSKCTGTVKDVNGDPIIGATVKVKNSNIAALTDINGEFSIDAPAGAVLEITYLGCEKVELKAGVKMNVTMKEETNTLNELVVVGYGVQKKANLTGSVASVSAEKLASRPVSSISSALAGEMPGVTAVQTSGAPGSQNATITVRGKNSINAASPLVIVDGVPGSMNVINPTEIETVTVLKDAASAAIYGVQAANGVILITTKKGKTGAAKVSYSTTLAWSSLLAKRDLVNAYDYAVLYNEAYLNENPGTTNLPFSDEQIEGYRTGKLASTDWYKEALTGNGFEQQHNVSISGGSANTTYNMYVGYLDQNGLTKDIDYKRWNARVNLRSNINKYITLGLNASGYRGTKKDTWNGFYTVLQGITRSHPTDAVYNDDGSYKYVLDNNPVAIQGIDNMGYKKTIDQEVFVIGSAELHPLPGLNVKGVYSFRNWTEDQLGFKKDYTYGNASASKNMGLREGYVYNYNYDYLTGQIIVDYTKSFGDHNLAVLAGMESYDVKYRYVTASRKGGGSNELGESLNTLDASSQKNTNGGNELTRLSWFGRLQYNYAGKYLFEANVRRDASSRFPKATRWGTFPAFSAGWRISEESFVKDNAAWLSNLKLRLGWGKTGNEELSSSDLYPGVSTYSYGSYMFGNTLYSTAYESRLVNEKLKWATVTNYELGLDAGFLDNMFTFELSVFKKKTNDMILYLPLQGVIGMDDPAQNVGSVQNTGFEVTIGHNFRINKDWSYSLGLNFSYVKNEILDMAGTSGATSDSNIWNFEGHPINSYYGYVADGFFNTEEELAAGPLRTGNETLGDIRYVDYNKDGKITAADRQILGNNFPSWTGGFNFSVKWKDLELSGLLQGAFDVDRYYNGEAAYAFFNSASALNRHKDRWTPTHHNASYPRLTLGTQTNYAFSSFWIQDASYVRLKNIMLAYNLPTDWLRVVGISYAQLYFSGENLLTFTGLEKGLDPEESNSRGWSYGNVKKISFGLKVTF